MCISELLRSCSYALLFAPLSLCATPWSLYVSAFLRLTCSFYAASARLICGTFAALLRLLRCFYAAYVRLMCGYVRLLRGLSMAFMRLLYSLFAASMLLPRGLSVAYLRPICGFYAASVLPRCCYIQPDCSFLTDLRNPHVRKGIECVRKQACHSHMIHVGAPHEIM